MRCRRKEEERRGREGEGGERRGKEVGRNRGKEEGALEEGHMGIRVSLLTCRTWESRLGGKDDETLPQ
jgi:hypothetical protein